MVLSFLELFQTIFPSYLLFVDLFQNDLKDFIEHKKIQAAGIYEQIMITSNFEKFAAELFSASFTLLKR